MMPSRICDCDVTLDIYSRVDIKGEQIYFPMQYKAYTCIFYAQLRYEGLPTNLEAIEIVIRMKSLKSWL